MPAKRLSPEAYKQAKRAEQREQIEQATRALLSSEGWRAWPRHAPAFARTAGAIAR